MQACDEPGLHDRHPPLLPRQQPGHAGEEDTAREYTHLSHQVEPGATRLAAALSVMSGTLFMVKREDFN